MFVTARTIHVALLALVSPFPVWAACEVLSDSQLCCDESIQQCHTLGMTCKLKSSHHAGEVYNCDTESAIQGLESISKLSLKNSPIDPCEKTRINYATEPSTDLIRDTSSFELRPAAELPFNSQGGLRTGWIDLIKHQVTTGEIFKRGANSESTVVEIKMAEKNMERFFKSKDPDPRNIGLGPVTQLLAPYYVLKTLVDSQVEICEVKDKQWINCHKPTEYAGKKLAFVTLLDGTRVVSSGIDGGHAFILRELFQQSRIHVSLARYGGEIFINEQGALDSWNSSTGTFKNDETRRQNAGLPLSKWRPR